MSNETKLPSLAAGGPVKAIVPQDFDGAYRIANAVVRAGMAPKGLDTPEKAMVAIMHGMEVGFTPMAALQSIAVVNGRPAIWGDGAIGLVQASGLMESIRETADGEGDAKTATCVVKRKGNPDPIIGKFSVADARKAGLWGKAGPWTQYPDRMLQMRARGFALRDGFSDVLRGLGIAEEVQDTPMRDITPAEPTIAARFKSTAPASVTDGREGFSAVHVEEQTNALSSAAIVEEYDPETGEVPQQGAHTSPQEDVADSPLAAADAVASSEEQLEWLANVAKFLWAVTTPGGEIGTLMTQRSLVPDTYPKPEGTDKRISDKAGSIYSYCKQVMEGALEKEDAAKIVSGIAGIEMEDLV